MATVAVTHIGLTGHVAPATRLGAVLTRQGHTVRAWAPEEHRQLIESTGTVFNAYEPAPVSGISGGVPGFAAMLAEATERHVGGLIDQLLADDVDLVIHDCHSPWGRVAADFLGLPRIVSYPLFPSDWRPAPPEHHAFLVPPGSQEAIARSDASRDAIVRKWGVDLGDWRSTVVSTGELTVSYTTEEIVGRGEPGVGWRYVGPLMDAGPPRQPGGERPLVYAALGTFSTFSREAYRVVIDGLADEPVDVLVSTGRGFTSPADLEPLPPNVVAREFVDSREVLSRARVHVTHGGCSSVHESLLAGVPMVCIPQAVDQSSWAHRIEVLGAGRIVDVNPASIRTGVRSLLDGEQSKTRAGGLGRRLAEYDGEARVAELVGHALAGLKV